MRYALAFTSQAEKDIIDAIRWYNDEKEGLGFEFYAALTEKLSLITQTPLQYAIRFKGIRGAGISKFPFLVYFKIYEMEGRLVIIGVFHTSRDQQEIKKRK